MPGLPAALLRMEETGGGVEGTQREVRHPDGEAEGLSSETRSPEESGQGLPGAPRRCPAPEPWAQQGHPSGLTGKQGTLRRRKN